MEVINMKRSSACFSAAVFPVMLVLLTFLGLPVLAFAQNINTPENFPDPQFRAAVEKFMGVAPGGAFTAAQAAEKSDVFDCSSCRIEDMAGIEFFTGITGLNCYWNQLTRLDVSANTALKVLNCWYNQLTSLDVSANTALVELYCGENQLTSLDVSANTALVELYCSENQLTHLDVSANTALVDLGCSGNPLTSLDVSANTALVGLGCSENQLTSLDVSANTALKNLSCWSNQLTRLDVSASTALEYLDCSNNQISSISSLVINAGIGEGDAIDIRYNNLDCGDWDEVQTLLTKLGEEHTSSDWPSSWRGLRYSPQNGLDPYDCTLRVDSWEKM